MSLSLQCPACFAKTSRPTTVVRSCQPEVDHCSPFRSKIRSPTIISRFKGHHQLVIAKAIEESKESIETETESEPESESQPSESNGAELNELGAEIKKVLKERKEEKEGDLWSGVGEEIREIEWPAFGKVLGTTGVVLGVIAGSSVVLLTVNAVLAELSDRVFGGKGVQDFFS